VAGDPHLAAALDDARADVSGVEPSQALPRDKCFCAEDEMGKPVDRTRHGNFATTCWVRECQLALNLETRFVDCEF